MVEAPNAKLVSGIVLLPLHKPFDIAEQLASVDVMSGGRLVFGSGIGYRDVEFKASGRGQGRGKRFEECLDAIKRLWTEDFVTMKGSHFSSIGLLFKPVQTNAAVDRRQCRCCRAALARMADTWFINPTSAWTRSSDNSVFIVRPWKRRANQIPPSRSCASASSQRLRRRRLN